MGQYAWMKPERQAAADIAASYCYHVYQDILCYRRPMPGWETRLAGYQPITADPPPAAQMQPLAQHVQMPASCLANRVASSKPVFRLQSGARRPKKRPKIGGAAAVSEATHEQLPDPAHAASNCNLAPAYRMHGSLGNGYAIAQRFHGKRYQTATRLGQCASHMFFACFAWQWQQSFRSWDAA